jgi:hypothetical protein
MLDSILMSLALGDLCIGVIRGITSDPPAPSHHHLVNGVQRLPLPD